MMSLKWKALLFATLFSFPALAQAEMKFEKKAIKYPKTKEGKLLQFEYPFTNTGDQPLIISDIKVACTCTQFAYPKRPILPNTKDTIHVTFDTNKKVGWQDRTLEIYSNAKNSPTTIRFKGMVEGGGK